MRNGFVTSSGLKLYYEIEGETAYVYAILDMRRDPLWIREELGRRQ